MGAGRFAPTPSGDLHIGSLIAATASCADALHRGAEHRIRVDDIDPPRMVASSADRIIKALDDFGIARHGDVIFQSTRLETYREALQTLASLNAVFVCNCSRPMLRNGQSCQLDCVANRLDPHTPVADQLNVLTGRAAVRLDTASACVQGLAPLHVVDRIQAPITVEQTTTLGTPVLWRKDGHVSYLLACSVDDSADITDVVRGADLWEGSTTQQLVIRLLERDVPAWAHVPCAIDANQQKLGKQTRATSIHDASPLPLLQKVWAFLGQTPITCATLDSFWQEAASSWEMDSVPPERWLRID